MIKHVEVWVDDRGQAHTPGWTEWRYISGMRLRLILGVVYLDHNGWPVSVSQ